MTRVSRMIFSVAALSIAGVLVAGDDSRAVVNNSTYTAVPPFVSANTVPNVLLLIDNSGSMSNRGCESAACGVLPDGTTSTTTVFTATTRYSGYFDSMSCYRFSSGDARFELLPTVKATLNEACPTTRYDGNFLNWSTFRRFDAVKKAMMGGDCYHPTAVPARAANGTCQPYGSPNSPTVKVQTVGVGNEQSSVGYNGGTGDLTYVGRIPDTTHSGNPAIMSFNNGECSKRPWFACHPQ